MKLLKWPSNLISTSCQEIYVSSSSLNPLVCINSKHTKTRFFDLDCFLGIKIPFSWLSSVAAYLCQIQGWRCQVTITLFLPLPRFSILISSVSIKCQKSCTFWPSYKKDTPIDHQKKGVSGVSVHMATFGESKLNENNMQLWILQITFILSFYLLFLKVCLVNLSGLQNFCNSRTVLSQDKAKDRTGQWTLLTNLTVI